MNGVGSARRGISLAQRDTQSSLTVRLTQVEVPEIVSHLRIRIRWSSSAHVPAIQITKPYRESTLKVPHC